MAQSKKLREKAPKVEDLASLRGKIEEARQVATALLKEITAYGGGAAERMAITNEVDETAPVLERAVEVIGDRESAYRWLGTPVRAIGYATPMSLLATAQGRSDVLAVLDRLEHGDL